MKPLFHLIAESEWVLSQNRSTYEPPSLKTEGFIHLSHEHQIAGTFKRFFSGRKDLQVLSIDPTKLSFPIKYEPADGDTFPHLYGPLNLDAVYKVEKIESFLRRSHPAK